MHGEIIKFEIGMVKSKKNWYWELPLGTVLEQAYVIRIQNVHIMERFMCFTAYFSPLNTKK